MSIPKVGDIVKLPQNTLLTKGWHKQYRKLDSPKYGFVTGINPERWPTTYDILIENETWEASESDIYIME